jgi:hypothetical protein
MAYGVFISHAKEDEKHAEAACDALESGGLRCWIAPRDIDPGKSWSAEIIKGIESSRVMLVIFSAHANESTHIKREVGQADERHLPVITFRVEDVEPADSLAYYLDSTHWLDAFPRPKEKHPQLVAAVKRLMEGGEPLPGPRQLQPRPLNRWLVGVGVALLAALAILGVWATSRDGAEIAAANANNTPGPSPSVTTTPSPSPAASNSNSPGGATVTPPTPTPPPETDVIAQLVGELDRPDSTEGTRSDVINRLGSLAGKDINSHKRIVGQLTEFIRRRAAYSGQCAKRPSRHLPADLQAALDVLASRRWWYGHGETEPLELSETDLSGAYFSKNGVHFEGVRLRNACLDNALLSGASFRCAYLSGASVSSIDVNETDFYGADLSGLKGLKDAAEFHALFDLAGNLDKPSCAPRR